MKKIAVLGVPASGKTTLANKLGALLHIPVYHLDKIVWRDNREYAPQAEILQKLSEIIATDRWIIDGSMPKSKALEMRIEGADTIIYLDISVLTVLWRQTKRFFKNYGKVRPDMGGNNKQKYPFTWQEVRHTLNYPTEDILSKLALHSDSKTVVVIRNAQDENAFLNKVRSVL